MNITPHEDKNCICLRYDAAWTIAPLLFFQRLKSDFIIKLLS